MIIIIIFNLLQIFPFQNCRVPLHAVLRRATGTGMVSMCKRGVSLSFISGRRLLTKEATSVEESSHVVYLPVIIQVRLEFVCIAGAIPASRS